MTLSELRTKEVIDVQDGRRLGKPIDLVLNESACVDALVVPVPGGILTFLKQEKEGCMVPWNRILRIGDDVILVEIHEEDGPQLRSD